MKLRSYVIRLSNSPWGWLVVMAMFALAGLLGHLFYHAKMWYDWAILALLAAIELFLWTLFYGGMFVSHTKNPTCSTVPPDSTDASA